MDMEALGFGLAALIGIAMGMLGGGGSVLAIPMLVYLLGFEVKEAIATSLVMVGSASLLGAVGHWRAGNVEPRVAGLFGAVAMVGAYLGARLAVYFTGAAQLLLFALVMIAAGVFMYRGEPPCEDCEKPDARRLSELPLGVIVAEGIGVGILTGLVGVGGGFLIVPTLVVLGRVPMKQAIGTSLLVIAMNATAGFYGYLDFVEVDWRFIAGFTGAAMMGIVFGTYLLRFASQHRLQRAFAIFLMTMGIWLLYNNRAVLLARDGSEAVRLEVHATESNQPDSGSPHMEDSNDDR